MRFGSPDSDIQDQLDALAHRLTILEPRIITTCKSILEADPDAPTAVYSLGDNINPFDGYCDMETDGGGWLIIFHGDDPSIWGTDTGLPGAVQWSHDMTQHALNMGALRNVWYLRHTPKSNGRFEILKIQRRSDLPIHDHAVLEQRAHSQGGPRRL